MSADTSSLFAVGLWSVRLSALSNATLVLAMKIFTVYALRSVEIVARWRDDLGVGE